jgi:hypothetical protein
MSYVLCVLLFFIALYLCRISLSLCDVKRHLEWLSNSQWQMMMHSARRQEHEWNSPQAMVDKMQADIEAGEKEQHG